MRIGSMRLMKLLVSIIHKFFRAKQRKSALWIPLLDSRKILNSNPSLTPVLVWFESSVVIIFIPLLSIIQYCSVVPSELQSYSCSRSLAYLITMYHLSGIVV